MSEFDMEKVKALFKEMEKGLSATEAARSLGFNERTARTWAKQFADMRFENKNAITTGTSTLYNQKGEVVLQWVKEKPDHSKDAMLAAIDELSGPVRRVKPTLPPKHTDENLCNLYTLTDCHVGMMAWAKESGEDWDLSIAEQTLVSAAAYLISNSPKAQVGFLNQLGDWLHFDSLAAITPTGGHILDADSRYPKVVRVATNILRQIVDLMLKRHEKVVVLMAEGNHDIASSVWLRHLFALLYENEPRVEVIDSELPYYAYQHGSTMLAFHHGHLKKNVQLPLTFAAQFPSMWGNTTKRYCHTGHMHHAEEKEHSGMKLVQHATIAARDAYAARYGFISERQMASITYHAEFGEVARNVVTPEMLGLIFK